MGNEINKSKRIINQRKSGLDLLFSFTNNTAIVDEEIVLNAMKIAGLSFYGAVDSMDQDILFSFYGVSFEPARNQGEKKWMLNKF